MKEIHRLSIDLHVQCTCFYPASSHQDLFASLICIIIWPVVFGDEFCIRKHCGIRGWTISIDRLI